MTMVLDHIDPSSLSESDRALINELNNLMQDRQRPALVGREGVSIELPDQVFHLLVGVIRNMKQGRAIALFPLNKSLTTKAAADFLGMSRPFLVELLHRGEIPYHKVGTHRRIYLKDLVSYQEKRDSVRRDAVDHLFDKIDKAGVYDNA